MTADRYEEMARELWESLVDALMSHAAIIRELAKKEKGK